MVVRCAFTQTARYRLIAPALAQAVAWGYPPAQVILLLGQYTGGEIPPAALATLCTWQAQLSTLAATPGYYLPLPPTALATLRTRKPFRQRVRLVGGSHGEPRFTPQGAWVAHDQAPALFRYLRRQGYQVNVPDGEPTPVPLPTAVVTPAALTALLVVCHTYQALRHYLPALAQVELDTLIRDLERALSDADHAAITQLLAAQRALIARAFAPDGAAPSSLRARLEAAIATGMPLTLAYIDTHAQRTRRVVQPLRLEERRGQTYLVARCDLRGEERQFRLDRMVAVEEAGEQRRGKEGEGVIRQTSNVKGERILTFDV
ncbi:MAG: WYL domain-containing protein [Anaerolineae bacterium]|nr:WYL domain-containing protein [Anaerolineae bacterium]